MLVSPESIPCPAMLLADFTIVSRRLHMSRLYVLQYVGLHF